MRQEDPYLYYVTKQSWTTNNNHKVFLVEHIETQVKNVMKVSPIGSLKRETVKPGENAVLLALGDSENIINVRDIYIWEGRIYTIIDYMEGKELTHVIQEYGNHYSESFIKYSIYMVACGLADMHAQGILHRDIKSDNVLCSSDGDIKLADMDISVFLTEE